MKKKADSNNNESKHHERETSREETTLTERALERENEDKEYIPVIVKRTDEAVRHPDDTLEKAVAEGLEQLYRSTLSLSLSSIAAGMILGFTAMVVAVVSAGLADLDNEFITRIASAAVYPLGFIVCIMSGTQLFTEHTATAVYPVLDRRAPIHLLLRLWLIVLLCNIAGAAISAVLLSQADNVIQAKQGYEIIAHHLVYIKSSDLILSSILAGWLMALGAWLILATPPTISQIACIYTVTFLIGLGGLHHSIAGSVEMLTAYFISDNYTFMQSIRFISLAVLGNLIGGSVFVAILNYGHIRKTQEIESD